MDKSNYDIIDTHISLIRGGDTILRDNKLTTVCNNNIKSGFCGVSIFGDSYNSGTKPVKKVIFKTL